MGTCRVCRRHDVNAINADLVDGKLALRALGRKYSVDHRAIHRHRKNCLRDIATVKYNIQVAKLEAILEQAVKKANEQKNYGALSALVSTLKGLLDSRQKETAREDGTERRVVYESKGTQPLTRDEVGKIRELYGLDLVAILGEMRSKDKPTIADKAQEAIEEALGLRQGKPEKRKPEPDRKLTLEERQREMRERLHPPKRKAEPKVPEPEDKRPTLDEVLVVTEQPAELTTPLSSWQRSEERSGPAWSDFLQGKEKL